MTAREGAVRVTDKHGRQSSGAAPKEEGHAVRAGDRIRWLGRLWRVNWAHRGLISIVSDEAPTFELINENGIDGPYEVLPS